MAATTMEITCAICCSDDIFQVLPCSHHFHTECIRQWLKLHNTCPNCREPVQNKSLIDDAGKNAEIRLLSSKIRELNFRVSLLQKALESRKNALAGALYESKKIREDNDYLREENVAVNEVNAFLNGHMQILTTRIPLVYHLRALTAAARDRWAPGGEEEPSEEVE